MRQIIKSNSPITFEDWKLSKGRSASYSNIPDDIKYELRNSLIKEQYGLCCYCGLKLEPPNMHIEHFKPQSNFKSLTLDYNNLHLSCMGKKYIESECEELDFCGHSKGNWFNANLIVSPLDPTCESEFTYLENGTIKGNSIKGTTTIEKLGLGTYLLNTQREAAIEAIIETIHDFGNLNEIEEAIEFLESVDEDGNSQSFSFIIVSILKDYI